MFYCRGHDARPPLRAYVLGLASQGLGKMCSVRVEHFKVRQGIILPLVLAWFLVVNNLMRIQVAAKVPFHYEAVLPNITVAGCVRMVRSVNQNVPICIDNPAALPASIRIAD